MLIDFLMASWFLVIRSLQRSTAAGVSRMAARLAAASFPVALMALMLEEMRDLLAIVASEFHRERGATRAVLLRVGVVGDAEAGSN